MPENDSNGPSGKGADGAGEEPAKDIEKSMATEGEESGTSGARDKENSDTNACHGSKSHACGKGQCCGRHSARRSIASRYSGNN